MHTTSFAQFMALALLTTPLVLALPVTPSSNLDRRYVVDGDFTNLPASSPGPVSSREPHHTAAQIAAKKAKAGARDLTQDGVEEDEDDALLTTLAPGGEIEARHHTAAQIAAKKAKAGKRNLTQDEIEEDEDDALLTTLAPGGEIEARHHTAAQIAAKKAKGTN